MSGWKYMSISVSYEHFLNTSAWSKKLAYLQGARFAVEANV